ncbi:MAG: serine hydrolase [Actinophytocola sp.]|nr:serine hydrolase [Actinophytocola sp.]
MARFARGGKDAVTVRQVLRHRSGFATGGSALGDIRAMTDWDLSVRRVERVAPRWAPGAVPAYQFLSYGFTLGELVRRITGTPVEWLLGELVLGPLDARDTHLGLTPRLWSRHVPLAAGGPVGRLVSAVVNRPATRAAVIPSAGVSTTARDVARFYAALLDGELLRPATLATLLTPTSDGEIDRYARVPLRWSEGFQLGGRPHVPGAISPMGRTSSRRAFGHNGSNCCLAWADPDRRLAYAYLTNRITTRRADITHHAAVADAVLAEL